MIQVKTPEEIKIMREGGKRHAYVLSVLAEACVIGASSFELEELARKLCRETGSSPAFLNYQPEGASYPYPAALCLSINEEIVHGLPNRVEKIIQEGDVVSLDMGLVYEGLITDSAITLVMDGADKGAYDLVACAEGALERGIAAAKAGHAVAEIGTAIEEYVRHNGDYTIYRELVGHGVGYSVHEEPNVPNFNTGQSLPKLPVGAVIAIEPMIGEGSGKIKVLEDDYTYVTWDGSRSAHTEHTVAITTDGPIVLTSA